MKSGIFHDTNEAYHAEEHLGSTSVKAMRISPAHFYEAWKGLRIHKPAYDEGTAVHSVLLEQDLSGFIARPEGIDGRTKEGKAALAELEASGKIVLKSDVFDSLEQRLDAFCSSNEAMRLIRDAKIEQSCYTQDHETGLYIKARPDIMKPGTLSDIKTVASMGQFERQVWNYGYNIQAGFYSLVIEQMGSPEVREFNFVVQEKVAPYGVRVFRLTKPLLDASKAEARVLLNRCMVHIKENKFPSYDDVVTELRQPAWAIVEDAFEGVG